MCTRPAVVAEDNVPRVLCCSWRRAMAKVPSRVCGRGKVGMKVGGELQKCNLLVSNETFSVYEKATFTTGEAIKKEREVRENSE